jgi:hypothetical protein
MRRVRFAAVWVQGDRDLADFQAEAAGLDDHFGRELSMPVQR